jgi:hypothetical protein
VDHFHLDSKEPDIVIRMLIGPVEYVVTDCELP